MYLLLDSFLFLLLKKSVFSYRSYGQKNETGTYYCT